MKRKTIALLLAALATSFAFADSWKVISVSNSGIKADGKVIVKGSVVSDAAVYTWLASKKKQWVRLANASGGTKVITSNDKTKNPKSYKPSGSKPLSGRDGNDAFLLSDTKSLASRGVDLLNEMDMRDFFAKPIVLEDSLKLRVPYDLDEQHVLFLQYEAPKAGTASASAGASLSAGAPKAEVINKVLPGEGNTVTIDDRIFMLDGKPTAPVTRTYRLYYYDMVENTTTLIADSLVIDVDKRKK